MLSEPYLLSRKYIAHIFFISFSALGLKVSSSFLFSDFLKQNKKQAKLAFELAEEANNKADNSEKHAKVISVTNLNYEKEQLKRDITNLKKKNTKIWKKAEQEVEEKYYAQFDLTKLNKIVEDNNVKIGIRTKPKAIGELLVKKGFLLSKPSIFTSIKDAIVQSDMYKKNEALQEQYKNRMNEIEDIKLSQQKDVEDDPTWNVEVSDDERKEDDLPLPKKNIMRKKKKEKGFVLDSYNEPDNFEDSEEEAPDFPPKKQYGEGLKEDIDEDGLNSEQIDAMMKKYPEYLGTIASDQVLSLNIKPKARQCFIMNLDKHNQKGSHWVGVFMDARPEGSNSVEYYNSFADKPTKAFMKDIKVLAQKLNANTYLKFKENRVIDQDAKTSNCGFFACKFLIDRLRGKRQSVVLFGTNELT